jgi:hypothetical protein
VKRVTKFVEPPVELPSGFTDVHQEIFAGRSYTVKAGFFWDSAEFFFVCGERYPWCPGEGAPGGGQVGSIIEGYFRFLLVGIRRHA